MADSPLNEPIPQIATANPFAVYAQDYARKKGIADLLLKNAQTEPQGQMVSDHYIAPSPFAQLGRIASIIASGRLNKQALGGQLGLANLLTQNRQNEADQLGGATGANRFSRIIQALASNDSQMVAAGKIMLEKTPGASDLKELVGKITPSSMQAVQQSGDFSQADPHVNGPVGTGPGGVPMSVNEVTGKPDFGPVTQHYNVNVSQMGPNATRAEGAKVIFPQLQKDLEGAQSAQEGIASLRAAQSILQNPNSIYNGPTAKGEEAWGNILQRIDPKKYGQINEQSPAGRGANTTAYQAAALTAAAQGAREDVGARGLSQYEEKVLQGAQGGDVSKNWQQLSAALDVAIGQKANKIQQYRHNLDVIKNAPPGPDPSTDVISAAQQILPLYDRVHAEQLDPSKYKLNKDNLYEYIPPTQQEKNQAPVGQPAPTQASPIGTPQPPAGLQLPPGFSYVGPAP